MKINPKGNKEISTGDELTDFLLYTTPQGDVKVDIFLHDESVWLTQKRMADLFGVEVQTINYHLSEVFESQELQPDSTIRKFRIVQNEGGRDVEREINYYNLDAILSVGYRVNSTKATQFRMWATSILREYIIKGFAIDDNRLKNGQYFGKDYFRELLELVRSIRASERRIYQQITDIFAECSIDYDPQSDTTKDFYAAVQNKFHFAIAGKTAAELIEASVDAQKPHMGLSTWKNAPNGRILKSDTTVAKNYLPEAEIKKLERTVTGYFDYIENLIENETTFSMENLAESVNDFLLFNKYQTLDGKGNVSQIEAEKKAHAEYDVFNKTQKIESDFDKFVERVGKLEGDK